MLILSWFETAKERVFSVRHADRFYPDSMRRVGLEGSEGVNVVFGQLLPGYVPDGADEKSLAAQSYSFSFDLWTEEAAKAWVGEKKISESPDAPLDGLTMESGEPVDIVAMLAAAIWEETENEIRYRVQDPEDFRKDTLRYVALKGIEGVQIVVGKLLPDRVPQDSDPEAMVLQSYRFARDVWDMDQAKRWIEAHEGSRWMAEEAIWQVTYGSDKRSMKATSKAFAANIKISAADESKGTDKRFSFILTHAGTNSNGDHFTPEELKKAAPSIIGKKIDLSHYQEIRDIVGIVVDAKYVDDSNGARVECVGELFTGDSENARLAYKLMRRGIVGYVSMECAYAEGECSYCGARHTSKANYCVHLNNYKGGSYRDKPVFEIFHNITFTGVGLLDQEGADPGAMIQQVATKENAMDLEQMKARIAELEAALAAAEEKAKADKEALETQVAELQAKLDELEGEKTAAARKARAEKLVDLLQKKGKTFADDAAKAAELARIEGLAEAELSAMETVVASLDDAVKAKDDNKAEADKKRKMTANAQPGDLAPVPDTGNSLHNELASVMTMLATGGSSQEG